MKALVALFALTLSLNAFAGGSISRADVLQEVCAESPNLCLVLRIVKLEETGDAVRMRDGSRIMPYEFAARIGGHPSWVVFNRDARGHIEMTIR